MNAQKRMAQVRVGGRAIEDENASGVINIRPQFHALSDKSNAYGAKITEHHDRIRRRSSDNRYRTEGKIISK